MNVFNPKFPPSNITPCFPVYSQYLEKENILLDVYSYFKSLTRRFLSHLLGNWSNHTYSFTAFPRL